MIYMIYMSENQAAHTLNESLITFRWTLDFFFFQIAIL